MEWWPGGWARGVESRWVRYIAVNAQGEVMIAPGGIGGRGWACTLPGRDCLWCPVLVGPGGGRLALGEPRARRLGRHMAAAADRSDLLRHGSRDGWSASR